MIKKIVLGFLLVIPSFLNAQEKSFIIKKFDSKARISSNPIEHNNTIYFGNDDSLFFAIDAKTLAKKWSFKTESIIRSKPVVIENIIYFKSGYTVYAVNSETGDKVWSHSKQSNKTAAQEDYWDYHSGAPVIHTSNIYFGFEDGTIHGFNLNSGEIKANLYADSSASIKSGLFVDKDMLYFGDWNGKLYAYNLNTNERLWKYDTYEKQEYPTFGQINTELTIYKDLLFFGARNPDFQVIDIKSAQKKWSFLEKDGAWMSGDPLIYNDTLFIAGSDNHKLYAFDPVSGDKFWEYEFLFNSFSKPVTYKDYIFLTTGDAYSVFGPSKGHGYLYALNRKNGSIVNFSLIGGNLNSTPVIKNENLYLCSEDGFLYKIDLNTFLTEAKNFKEKGYRAFEINKVDSESDANSVKIDYKVNFETYMKILITDLSDNEVKNLYYDIINIGEHTMVWDKMDNTNTKAKPGYYFVEISSGDSVMKTFFSID
jgi:eukaryotic-like serine/threonine-protein kinase